MGINPLSSKGIGVWICAIYILRLKITFILILYHDFNSWRRKWQPTPVLLPGKSHGWRSLVGYSPWGRRVGCNWTTSFSTLTFHDFSGTTMSPSLGLTSMKILWSPNPKSTSWFFKMNNSCKMLLGAYSVVDTVQMTWHKFIPSSD